jgi:hypothetical protein
VTNDPSYDRAAARRRGGLVGLLVAALAVVSGCDAEGPARGPSVLAARDAGVADGARDATPHDARPAALAHPPSFDDAGFLAPPCNGAASLCKLTYDRVTFAGTHASAAYVTPPWSRTAQHESIRRQLDDGVRAVFLEVHPHAGKLSVCYGDCDAGSVPLANSLGDVRGFLGDNPRDVATLVVENHAGAALKDAVDAARLAPFVHPQAPDEAWPTLGELVDTGERLVLLVDEAGDGGASGFTPLWDVAFATSDAAPDVSAFDCAVARGEAGEKRLFVVHQHVRDATEDSAKAAGKNPFLGKRLGACETEQAHVPNLVDVDFYDVTDVVDATGVLNRSR